MAGRSVKRLPGIWTDLQGLQLIGLWWGDEELLVWGRDIEDSI